VKPRGAAAVAESVHLVCDCCGVHRCGNRAALVALVRAAVPSLHSALAASELAAAAAAAAAAAGGGTAGGGGGGGGDGAGAEGVVRVTAWGQAVGKAPSARDATALRSQVKQQKQHAPFKKRNVTASTTQRSFVCVVFVVFV